jgi:hypothetical protein
MQGKGVGMEPQGEKEVTKDGEIKDHETGQGTKY